MIHMKKRRPAGRLPLVEALEGRRLLAADVVIEWDNIAINAIRADQTQPGPGWASRNMAIMHAAIYDAVNAIDQSYQPYLVNVKAPSWASEDAAAATAAYRTLSSLYPAQQSTFNAALKADLKHIRNGPAEAAGMLLGAYVANRILAARANDGSSTIVPYQDGTQPGQYRATPPDYTPAWGPGWGQVKPFTIPSASAFQAPPPPDLTSADYTAAYNEVKSLGASNSTTRTADQTQIADFWSYDRQTLGTPIVHQNQITQTIAQQEGNTMVQNARLFALTNLAMADAGIACWNAKFTYNFWRPVSGIQNGNSDGNPDTAADPNWTPLGAPNGANPRFTPPFPSYTSGHAIFAEASFDVLANYYHTDNIHFTATSDELPGVTRSYNSLSQASAENAKSRIYMGVHWTFDCDAAQVQGSAIANYVSSNVLQPNGQTQHPASRGKTITAPDANSAPVFTAADKSLARTFSTEPVSADALASLLSGASGGRDLKAALA